MAAAHINEVVRSGGTAANDIIVARVLFYGNGFGCKQVDVQVSVATNATIAQFKTAVGNAIVAAGAAQSPAYSLTTADIGGHG